MIWQHIQTPAGIWPALWEVLQATKWVEELYSNSRAALKNLLMLQWRKLAAYVRFSPVKSANSDQEVNAGSLTQQLWKTHTTTHCSEGQAAPHSPGRSARTCRPRDLAVGMQMCNTWLNLQKHPCGRSYEHDPASILSSHWRTEHFSGWGLRDIKDTSLMWWKKKVKCNKGFGERLHKLIVVCSMQQPFSCTTPFVKHSYMKQIIISSSFRLHTFLKYFHSKLFWEETL